MDKSSDSSLHSLFMCVYSQGWKKDISLASVPLLKTAWSFFLINIIFLFDTNHLKPFYFLFWKKIFLGLGYCSIPYTNVSFGGWWDSCPYPCLWSWQTGKVSLMKKTLMLFHLLANCYVRIQTVILTASLHSLENQNHTHNLFMTYSSYVLYKINDVLVLNLRHSMCIYIYLFFSSFFYQI